MDVRIVGKNLIITLPIVDAWKDEQRGGIDGRTSKGGKSRIVAGTGGFSKTTLVHEGKPVSVSVNAIIPL